MFIVGYLLAIAILVLLIPGLIAALGITHIREANLRKPLDLPYSIYINNDEDSEEEFDEPDWRDEDIEWEEINQEPRVVYEEDKSFVFPRIKIK